MRGSSCVLAAVSSVGISAVVASLLIVGCGAGSQAPVWAQPPAQLIITFTEAVADPARPDFVEQLSHDAGVRLMYRRPMSGGAHVFRVEGSLTPAELAEVMRRVASRRDVVHVEPDRLLRHQ